MTAFHNHLLCELSDTARGLMARQLSKVPLGAGTVLQPQGEAKRYGYFPESGLVSVVRIMSDGSRVEVCLIGREGLVGGPTGLLPAFMEAEVQVSGEAWRIEAAMLQLLIANDASVRDVLGRYAEYLLDEARMNAVCNAAHSVERRLCKWLLRCRDRLDSDSLGITQEFIAEMLSVQRTSITAALQRLAGRGVLRTGRGKIEILDAAALKARSCECYEEIAGRLPELGLAEASDRGECAA